MKKLLTLFVVFRTSHELFLFDDAKVRLKAGLSKSIQRIAPIFQ